MAKHLTAAAVAKIRPAKDRIEVPDAGARGLYLVVQPSGAKSWALRFRRPDGRPAKLALGTVYLPEGQEEPNLAPVIGGHLTLAGAHRLVAELRHQIAHGHDPAFAHFTAKKAAQELATESATRTFGPAARDYVDHARTKIRRWRDLALLLGLEPNTLGPIKDGLAERWANTPIDEIMPLDVDA
jgi:hypothetical protein